MLTYAKGVIARIAKEELYFGDATATTWRRIRMSGPVVFSTDRHTREK